MTEGRKKRRNLFTIWHDYKKVFNSVPHEWLIYALKLAKVPSHLVSSIEHLLTQWCTVVRLDGENESISTDIIHFLKGIFQGGSLSVLFILTVNPLSFLLRNLKGYQCHGAQHVISSGGNENFCLKKCYHGWATKKILVFKSS